MKSTQSWSNYGRGRSRVRVIDIAALSIQLSRRRRGRPTPSSIASRHRHSRVDPEIDARRMPPAAGARRRCTEPSSGRHLSARRRRHSTTAPTASIRRGRRSTPSTKTTSCRCVPSTTTASSSRKSRRVADGLGPTFNAQACRECHQNIVTGGASQIAEHRTGRLELLQFVESVGGSLIQSRSTHPDIFERVPFEDSVSTLRISTNTLGAGFIEAIANDTLLRHSRPRSRRRSAARRWKWRCSRPTTRRASGASAGRASTPASSRSRPMPI